MRIKTTTVLTLMCVPVIICLVLCAINFKSVTSDSKTLPFAMGHKYTEEHIIKYTGFGVDLYIYDSGVKDDGTHLTFKSDYGMNPINLVVSCAIGDGIMSLVIILAHLLLAIIDNKKNKKKYGEEEAQPDKIDTAEIKI